MTDATRDAALSIGARIQDKCVADALRVMCRAIDSDDTDEHYGAAIVKGA